MTKRGAIPTPEPPTETGSHEFEALLEVRPAAPTACDESRAVSRDRSTTVGKDDNLAITNNLTIDAGDSVTIKTGDASPSMKKGWTISLKGKDIVIEGSGQIPLKADSDVVITRVKVRSLARHRPTRLRLCFLLRRTRRTMANALSRQREAMTLRTERNSVALPL